MKGFPMRPSVTASKILSPCLRQVAEPVPPPESATYDPANSANDSDWSVHEDKIVGQEYAQGALETTNLVESDPAAESATARTNSTVQRLTETLRTANGPPNGSLRPFVFISSAGPNDFSLRLNGDNLEVVDQKGQILACQSLSATDGVRIQGEGRIGMNAA